MKLNFKTQSRSGPYLSVWDFALLLIPLLMSFAVIVFYFYILFQHLNFKGVHAIKKNDPNAAVQYFSQFVEEESLNPWAHLNLALAYDLNKNPLKSLQIYKVVSSQFKGLPQFFSYFNQAELNGRLGFLDKALENYQQALEIKYKEKEIKESIELLFQDDKNNKDQKSKDDKKKEDEKKKDKQNSGEGRDNPQGKAGQDQKKDGDQEKPEQKNNNVEKNTDNEENKNLKKGDLSEEQERAILKAIEQQEGEVRAKAFKNKNQYRDKTEKDW